MTLGSDEQLKERLSDIEALIHAIPDYDTDDEEEVGLFIYLWMLWFVAEDLAIILALAALLLGGLYLWAR